MNLLIFNIILVVYLLIIIFLGYLGYRGTKNLKDYMVAGRKTHPYVMAISYGATFVSTSAIVGFGGIAATYGMGILWLPFLNIFFGIIIAFLVFGKKTRKMGDELDARLAPFHQCLLGFFQAFYGCFSSTVQNPQKSAFAGFYLIKTACLDFPGTLLIQY
ncbi:MAG: hypothetical protein JW997_04895 [Actinobacteria bacterium]|nr:hypothetical protein [Actinomycetota bacterium]